MDVDNLVQEAEKKVIRDRKEANALTAEDVYNRLYAETVFDIQEWGIKNELRLFGISIADYVEPLGDGKFTEPKPEAKTLFTDLSFENMLIFYFDIKETSGKLVVSISKVVCKWPIKFARTKIFENKHFIPVGPIYNVLVEKGIILPFKGTIKRKDWKALPFEDMGDIKSTEI